MSSLAPAPDFAKGASGPANVYDTSPSGLGLNPAYLGGSTSSAMAVSGSGSELAYTEFGTTVSVTGTSEGAANTVVTASPITVDGGTPIILEFWCHRLVHGTTNINLEFFRDSTGIGGLIGSLDGGTAPVILRRRITPAVGTYTFSVVAWVDAGTGQVQAGAGGAANNLPGFIRVTKA